jgi:hypothetical protein
VKKSKLGPVKQPWKNQIGLSLPFTWLSFLYVLTERQWLAWKLSDHSLKRQWWKEWRKKNSLWSNQP